MQVVEDGEGLLPGVAGGGWIPGGEMSVGQVAERPGFAEPVADLAEHDQRMAVAGGGFGPVAELVLGEAEAVPGRRLTAAIPDCAPQFECPPARRSGLLIVAELRVAVAAVIQGPGLAGLVAERAEQAERLLGVAECGDESALALVGPAQGLVRAGLAGLVAKLAVQLQASRQVDPGLVAVSQTGVLLGQQPAGFGGMSSGAPRWSIATTKWLQPARNGDQPHITITYKPGDLQVAGSMKGFGAPSLSFAYFSCMLYWAP